MALRVTRQYADVLGTGDGKARVTRQYVEVLASGDSKLRVSRQYVEVLSSAGPAQVTRQCVAVLGDPPPSGLRVTRQAVAVLAEKTTAKHVIQQFVEIAGNAPAGGSARVQHQVVEVLGNPQGVYSLSAAHTLALTHSADTAQVAINVGSTSTLAIAHLAERNLVREVVAEHTLALSDEATGGKIYQVSAEQSLVLSDEAGGDCIRPVVTTLSLSHVATGDVIKPVVDMVDVAHEASQVTVFDRLAVDTLSVTEEATVAYAKRVHSIDVLEVVDEAVAEHIKPVQQSLSLTHLAQVDLLRRGFDTLTPIHEASVLVVYARPVAQETLALVEQATVKVDYLRPAADTLALGQTAVGDLCKVGTHTLTLTDVAEASVIRLAHDDLALTHQAESNWVFTRRRADTLALTHMAVKSAVRSRSAVAALSLTHQATASVAKLVVDTLSLSHEALVDNIRRASSTLMLNHSADATNTRLAAHDDLIGLSHRATVGFVKQVSAANTLHLTDKARSGVEIGSAGGTLQELHYNFDPVTGQLVPYYVGLQDRADVAVVHGAPYGARSVLSLSDRALGVVIHADAIACEATDVLSLTDSNVVAQLPFFRTAQQAADSLSLVQAAEVVASKVVSSTLALAHAATVVISRATLAVSDSLNLGQAVAFVLVSADVLHQYHPFVGEGVPGAPTPPSATCPTPLSGIGNCRLVYPVSHPTEHVDLRNPEFGNKDRLQFNRISRETRGGTLVVFADPIWPKVETQVLTIKGLSRKQVQAYLDFVEGHLGLEVGFVDWEGFYWKGVIMNPAEPTVQDDRSGFTISFELECEPATWEP